MSTNPEDMQRMLNDEDDDTEESYLGLSAPAGGGLSALDVPGAAAALAKMARSSEQARSALQRAREQIVARRYPKALPWLEISAALSKPTRTGAIGEVFGNVSQALAPSIREREAFKQGREKELLGIDTQIAGLDQSEAAAQLKLAELQARLRNQQLLTANNIVIGPDGMPRYAARPEARGQEAWTPPGDKLTIDQRQESEEAKTVGRGMAEQYLAIQKGGLDAPTKLSKLDRLEYLLEGLNTGKPAPAFADLASIGEFFGIKLDKNLGPKQAAQSLAREIALTLRNPSGGAGMPGALSNADRDFLVSMTPGLSQTPEGNRLIMETARKLAKRDMEVAKVARDYRKKYGRLDEGFYDALEEFANANPLFAKKKVATAPAPGAVSEEEAAPSAPPPAKSESKADAPYGRAPPQWSVDPADPPPRASPQAEADLRANPGLAQEFLEHYKYLPTEL